jgi:glyoxylase I family protein
VPPNNVKLTARGGCPVGGGAPQLDAGCSADSEEVDVGIAIRGLCPLIQVFDMPTSLHFYRDTLGFVEVQKSAQGDDVSWAWLRHGEAEVMLNTAYDVGKRPPVPDSARVAAHADTILYVGCQDLESAYAYLVARREGSAAEGGAVRDEAIVCDRS